MKISLAPLQGYTDWVFRQAYKKYFKGVDEFYTPFLVLQNTGKLKSSHVREIEPFEKRCKNMIPQFLSGIRSEFRFFEDYFAGLGYERMNWNLGCPYPMVTRRKRGSGLLPYPEIIKEILKEEYHKRITLSVKMRLGLLQETELYPVLDVLAQFDIDEIIIHPRTGKQLYKGAPNRNLFKKLIEDYRLPLAYNGDIESLSDFESLVQEIPGLKHIMIGRGVLKDLWLPEKIKNETIPSELERRELLREFHNEIFSTYVAFLSGETQILQKMKPFWEYFSRHFYQDRKVYKAIKKSSGFHQYNQAVTFAFQQELTQ